MQMYVSPNKSYTKSEQGTVPFRRGWREQSQLRNESKKFGEIQWANLARKCTASEYSIELS